MGRGNIWKGRLWAVVEALSVFLCVASFCQSHMADPPAGHSLLRTLTPGSARLFLLRVTERMEGAGPI